MMLLLMANTIRTYICSGIKIIHLFTNTEIVATQNLEHDIPDKMCLGCKVVFDKTGDDENDKLP